MNLKHLKHQKIELIKQVSTLKIEADDIEMQLEMNREDVLDEFDDLDQEWRQSARYALRMKRAQITELNGKIKELNITLHETIKNDADRSKKERLEIVKNEDYEKLNLLKKELKLIMPSSEYLALMNRVFSDLEGNRNG